MSFLFKRGSVKLVICEEMSMPAVWSYYGRNDFDDDKAKYSVKSRPIHHDRYGEDGTGGSGYLPKGGRIWKYHERDAE